VLDWWPSSGLRLSYTEQALENAGAKSHIEVLEWWKKISESWKGAGQGKPRCRSKVGKSILAAAQSRRADVVRWWEESGIPYAYEQEVSKLASTYGNCSVLTVWREVKGARMIFDNQVLVGATKDGHEDVPEWWKKSCLSVEYKTCDIKEVMEDAVGRGGENMVREQWSRNGFEFRGWDRRMDESQDLMKSKTRRWLLVGYPRALAFARRVQRGLLLSSHRWVCLGHSKREPRLRL
jgi:hypothetical protein